jgi:pyroglutamyl-peptidase
MRILLSGFEPFGGSVVNPAQRIVEAIVARGVAGVEIVPLLLPVVGGLAPKRLLAAFRKHAPDAVLCLGESGQASTIVVERVAVNLRDYRIADNHGHVRRDAPVVRGAPAAYFATLPVRAIVESIRAAGVPATISLSAGTFICNEVMFSLLHASAGATARCGFIHVPQLPEQCAGEQERATRPTMALETAAAGIEAALRAVAGQKVGSRKGVLRKAPRRLRG